MTELELPTSSRAARGLRPSSRVPWLASTHAASVVVRSEGAGVCLALCALPPSLFCARTAAQHPARVPSKTSTLHHAKAALTEKPRVQKHTACAELQRARVSRMAGASAHVSHPGWELSWRSKGVSRLAVGHRADRAPAQGGEGGAQPATPEHKTSEPSASGGAAKKRGLHKEDLSEHA